MKHGFSLVELSIVLVILGLLTGGILAGQSLIRAAELRSVVSDYNRYTAAVATFRDKYMSVPGDFRDATRFWNRQAATSDCISNSGLSAAGSPGACDGNGNGSISPPGAANQAGEIFQAWRHLALAGLIEGSYSGAAGAGNGLTMSTGNTPASRLSNAGWGIRETLNNTAGDGTIFAGSYGSWLQLGGFRTTSDNAAPVLKPEEAWNVDTKMDDGKPGTGGVRVRFWDDCTPATLASQTDAAYDVSVVTTSCTLMFPNFL